MGGLWGLSDWDLVKSWYLPLFALPLVVVFLLKSRPIKPFTRPEEASKSTNSHPISIYELALLAGGPGRVIETAMVKLLDDKRISITSSGRLNPVAAPTDPIESAAFQALPSGDGPQAARPRWKMERALIQPLLKRLRDAGLVSKFNWRALGILIYMLLLLGLGVARLIIGISGRPFTCPHGDVHQVLVGCLLLFVILVNFVVCWVCFLVWRGGIECTAAGTAVLRSQKSREAALALAGAGSIPTAVALDGLAAYPDPEIRAALKKTTNDISLTSSSSLAAP